MLPDGIRFQRYMNAGARRFSFWVILLDTNSYTSIAARRLARRQLAAYFAEALGIPGDKWQYDSADAYRFIIKLDRESDATMMVLKLNR